jgi:hypothetical protein
MFLATSIVLALLRAPRRTEFDQKLREARATIGWPPLGRQRMIPFSDIAGAKVWRLIRLNDLGYARPALVLRGGETVFLSTYDRSPGECREIVGNLEQLLSRQSYSESANVYWGSAGGHFAPGLRLEGLMSGKGHERPTGRTRDISAFRS